MFTSFNYEDMIKCGSNDKKENSEHLVCVWLNKPNMYAYPDKNEDDYNEVYGMANAWTFDNIEKAEMFIEKRNVRNATIVSYHSNERKKKMSIYDLESEH